VFNALHAGRCVTESGTPGHATAIQLVTHISSAIRALEAARAIVVDRMEDHVTR